MSVYKKNITLHNLDENKFHLRYNTDSHLLGNLAFNEVANVCLLLARVSVEPRLILISLGIDFLLSLSRKFFGKFF